MNRFCCEKEIDFQWIFNPPPYLSVDGGRLGKSVKRELKAITLDRVSTDEALYTFLCKIQCIINQRPLTTIRDDVNDFNTLTPNHLLIGEAHSNQPLGEFRSKEINYPKKMDSSSSSFQYFMGSLEEGISPDINSTERGVN